MPADALLNGLNMASMQAAAATYVGGPVLDDKIMPVVRVCSDFESQLLECDRACAAVQLYVGGEATRDVVRAPRELRAFQKVALAPGDVGASSRDIRVSHELQWAVPRDKRAPPPDAATAFDPF